MGSRDSASRSAEPRSRRRPPRPLPPRPPGADSPTGNRLRKVETKDWIADSLARTFSYGQPPPRYENHLSGTETETHPVSAFVKSTLKGLQVREE